MKGLEFVFLAVGSILEAYLRFKVVESPLFFNILPVNVLIVNVVGAFILGVLVIMLFFPKIISWHFHDSFLHRIEGPSISFVIFLE